MVTNMLMNINNDIIIYIIVNNNYYYLNKLFLYFNICYLKPFSIHFWYYFRDIDTWYYFFIHLINYSAYHVTVC